MTPKCCQACPHLTTTGTCDNYTKCGKWLNWFRREWQGIRKAANLIIEKRERRKEKLEELRKELQEEGKQ
jgi:Fic family protein